MKDPRHFLLASAIALAGLAALPLPATTVVGTGTAASCTEAALNAAVGEANATLGIVSFHCGAAPHTLVVTTGRTLMNGVTVDGGGKITLSGGAATRIFNLPQGAAVAIKDITLTRGFESFGGCILVQGSAQEPAQLLLTRVRFDNCDAKLFGGAIAATRAALQLVGGTFVHNDARTGGGGAISLNGGSLAAQGSQFFFNSAFDQGGAMQVWFATVQIDKGYFFDNQSESPSTPDAGGGALLLRSSAGTVSDTDFIGNEAGRQGGAVYLHDTSSLIFEDSRLETNYAIAGGGAVFVDATATAVLRRSGFHANSASGSGGAVQGRGDVHVQASTFSDNWSEDQGSAFYADNGGTLNLVGATLADNFRVGAAVHPAQIGWVAGAAVTVHNTLFRAPASGLVPSCAGSGGVFSSSIWPDNSCPWASGAGNITFTAVPLRPRGFSCGSAATELTPSYALPPGSFAIDRGSCRPGDPTFDQRGLPRPQGAACDVGATEFFVPCDGPFFADGFETGHTQSWSIVLP